MRRNIADREQHLLQVKAIGCGARDSSMAFVDWIEGTAEQADIHAASALRASCTILPIAYFSLSTPSPVTAEMGYSGSRFFLQNFSRRESLSSHLVEREAFLEARERAVTFADF